jgi:DHA1 family multidrug resistance protein-like MFS transporter
MVQDLLRDSITHTTFAYPAYAASVLAGNDFFRSVIASVFPLFGRAFLVSLGLGPGSALLAGISAMLMPVFWVCRYHVSIDALVDEKSV